MPTLSTIGAACARAWGFTSGLVKDQYFNLVSLLLPGNGTNGAQNNTFLDGSSNNFTITRNGNTTQGTFSPFSQTGWGNYFDGNGDSLTAPSGASISGTGDFTVECWVYPTAVPGSYNIIVANDTSGGLTAFGLNTNGTIFMGRSLIDIQGTSSNSITFNSWNHIAISRNSSTVKIFVNGVQGFSGTISTNYNAGTVRIGTDGGGTLVPYTGYISNLRFIQGTAVYTGNFTPSTTPLTAISGTSLLTCQSNRFRDASTNNFTITRNGDTSVVAFSPFAQTQSYSAAAVGGSGYFDGTGDYLEIANNAAFQFGSGDFTLESWVYLTSYNASAASIIIQKYTGAFPNCEFLFQIGTNGSIGLAVDSTSAETFIGTTSNAVPVAAWTHCVATKSGSALRIFVNGKLVKYGTTALTIATTTTPVQIGNNMFGYSGGTRVFKGSIPTDYQTSSTTEGTQIFTPPTAPLTTTSQGGSSPSLLLNFTNAGITDATAKNDLETVGNAQISTTQSKWGGGSMYFDGTGDYLKSNVSTLDLYGFGGDFAIELWLYRNATGQTILVDSRPTGGGGTSAYYVLYVNTSNVLSWFVGGSVRITGTTTISNSTWYHIAIARSGSSTKMYLNGTQEGSTYTDSTALICASGRPYVGADANDLTSNLNGYIDDLRITKGNARGYTGSTITVPTAPFPVQ